MHLIPWRNLQDAIRDGAGNPPSDKKFLAALVLARERGETDGMLGHVDWTGFDEALRAELKKQGLSTTRRK